MQRLDLDVRIIHSRNDEQSINLASRIIGEDSNRYRSLVLNAHVDIAPVDAPHFWTHPPFAANIADGCLYGRGSQDDKAGIATILLTLAAIRDLGLSLGGDVIVHSVIEEETTGNGTRAVLANGYGGDGVIICDGTWPERVIYAHLGQVSFRVTVEGQPMAASNVGRTSPPFDRAASFVSALKQRLSALHCGGGPFEGIDPPFYVNVGAVHGGIWCGAVPAALMMDIQIGFSPPFTVEQMEMEVAALAGTIPDVVTEPWILKREPFRADRANRMINEVAGAVRNGRGKEIKTQAVGGYTDMACFSTPDICLHGPGGGGGAHGTDEHYVLSHMSDVAQDLILVATSWCWQTKEY
jgi:acetylornithine deacetylase